MSLFLPSTTPLPERVASHVLSDQPGEILREFCVLALLREGERYSYELVPAPGDADGPCGVGGDALSAPWPAASRTVHPLAVGDLERLRRAGRGLPPGRRREVLLWGSRAGTTRDKRIGTLVVRGTLLVLAPIAATVYLARRAA